jgi:hypothetical protein
MASPTYVYQWITVTPGGDLTILNALAAQGWRVVVSGLLPIGTLLLEKTV